MNAFLNILAFHEESLKIDMVVVLGSLYAKFRDEEMEGIYGRGYND